MTCGNVLFLLGFARQSCRVRLDGVYRYAAKRGMKIRVVENAYSRTDIAALIDFWNPRGIICSCGFGMGGFSPIVFGDIPVVYYDAPPGRGRCVAVMSDGEQIGRAAAHELLRLDYPSAAFVPFFKDLYWSRERGRAFGDEMNAVGVRCATFGGASSSAAERMRKLSEWLESLPRPCGVFAANDIIAEEVAVAAERVRLRIPRDIALVGVDNHEQLCVNLPVPLTSIQVDFEQGGYLATDKLAGLIDGTMKSGDMFRYPMLKVVRRMSTHILPTPATAFSDRMAAFIRDHVRDGVSVDDAVKAFGYSRRQTEKLFRAGCGKSILAEIHDAIYDQACMLAKNRKASITSVADSLGGISRSQLDRIFLARTGLSVRAWLDRR